MSDSLLAVFADLSQRRGQVPALGGSAGWLTYDALHAQLLDIGSQLSGLGIRPGEPVAMVATNDIQTAVLSLGVLAHACLLPVNPDCKSAECRLLFERLRPRLLIGPAQHAACEAASELGIAIAEPCSTISPCSFGMLLQTESQDHAGRGWPPLHGSTAIVLQTSGTTGRSKLVPITRSNLLAAVGNLRRTLELGDQDRCLHFLPMFHVGGLLDVLLAPLAAGGQVYCAASFSPDVFFRDLDSFRPTWTQAVPVMLQAMLAHVEREPELVARAASLRFVRSVSAPLPDSIMCAFEKTFSVPVVEIYGMTETTGVIASNPLPPRLRKPGTVGVVVGSEVRLVNETGALVCGDGVGEVQVRGETVASGYLEGSRLDSTSHEGEWFRTGDLARFDEDGYLRLVGRVKDIINRGGEKVSPHEVDQVILAHPDVKDAAVFAIPHPSLGEEVAALISLRTGSRINSAQLQDFLRERLAYYKLPRMIRFVDEVPRTPGGKLRRGELAALYSTTADDNTQFESEHVAPDTAITRLLAGVWERVLRKTDIGLDADFFQLGGDSLKAASCVNELQLRFGDTLYVSSLFEAPTLRSYEKFLRRHHPELVAKMLGDQVMSSRADSINRVTTEMISNFESMIVNCLREPSVSLPRNRRAMFVLSPPRSGSTLLRAMLAGHPSLFAPPELYLLSYEDLADRKSWFDGAQSSQLEGNIRCLMAILGRSAEECKSLVAKLEARKCSVQEYYALLQGWLGDRTLVDKTPAYAANMSVLERAELYFDQPFYIHLVRHPYGMIRSFEEARLDQLWLPRLTGSGLGRDSTPFQRRHIAEMVWIILQRNILLFLETVPPERRCQVRFEDLVEDPETTMRLICDSAGVPFSASMLRPQEDPHARMTDGIHDVSRMIGDPKFHSFRQIESAVADQWKQTYETDFLSAEAWKIASRLGYTETVVSVRDREEFDF